ncbi:Bug family tripartite tricarboxylate transporter substrate binding protein [Cupriavidus sp. CuC1]|uniref:Bug family tripartite tricarboxylate transporter substrate binding protein n=1 Tax=Cupriavidus sp. CuC1 TaxID=3373131 RepID=UPI0037D76024
MISRFRRCLLLAATVLVIPTAFADSFPSRPVRLVVPWPAGGGTDVVVRVFAKHLSERLGQNVVVENRPGANGMIGTELTSRATPDGYTLGIASVETHAINPQVYRKVSYDAFRQFEPVGRIGSFPYALVVGASVPADSVEAFTAYAKQAGGRMSYGSWGVGSSSQVAMEMYKAATGVDMMHVPFTGAAPALAALAAGQIDALMIPVSIAAPYHRSGKARILAVAAPERLPEVPRVPTLKERGIDVIGGTWLVVVAPAGVPSGLVEKLNSEIDKVVRDRPFVEAMQRMSVLPDGGTPGEIRKMLASEYQRWGVAIKKADIRLD